MKVKVFYVMTIIVALIIGFSANYVIVKITKGRYHQHLEVTGESTCKEDESVFCTNLPIVKVDTLGNVIPEILGVLDERIKIKASIEFIDSNNGTNRLSDISTNKESIYIGHRGNSSLDFDKHQYSIKIVNKNDNPKDISVLGMVKDNSWVLNGPFLDKTQIRNYLAYNITGEIMKSVPNVRFCELFLNDEYQGLYVMIERISRNITNITNYKPKWSNGMTSYIIRTDRYNENDTMINNFSRYANRLNKENGINIVYPSDKEMTPNIISYIEQDFSEFEKMLYSYDYKDYEKYIDTDSFVDYLIINEFFRNADAGTHSTYLYKDVRGKIKMGPVWDFNNAIDNYTMEVYSTSGFIFQDKPWYVMLMKDEKFVNKVIKKYKELRNTYLNEEYIQDYITKTVEYIMPAVKRNFEKWGYTLDASYKEFLKPIERNYTSYEEALNQVRTYLIERGKWLDENIELLKQFSHKSVNKAYNGV